MRFLYWRNRSLWSRYPLPGKPEMYPLGIYRLSDSKGEIARCLAEGEKAIAALRTKALETKLFGNPEEKKQEHREYTPRFWRIVGRYFYYHLRYKKTGQNERYHLMHCLKAFGRRNAKQIFREDIEKWRNEMKADGAEVNTVNNRFAYLCRVYSYANSESNPSYQLRFDPTVGMHKMSGGKVRQFLLTPERFERNYAMLRDGCKWPKGKPNKHMTEWEHQASPRFALFYLAMWELGRRPEEVSQYDWAMVTEIEIDGLPHRVFMVPSEITKTEEPQPVPISKRLWAEMSQLGYRHGLVFRNEDGERWRYWDRHIGKLKQVFGAEAGVLRDCRRGFISRKCELEGRDPEHVRQCSGHRTTSAFRRYRIGELRNLISVVDDGTADSVRRMYEKYRKIG